MKKYLIILLALPLALSSCLKNDKDVFGQIPGERMSEFLAEVNTILTDAPNGWEMTYYPGRSREHGGYKIYMRFDGNEDVVMASEVSFLTSGLPVPSSKETETSLYTLGSDYGPTLNFVTENSLFHIFSAPGSIVKPDNIGFGGDAEFIIMSASPEKIVLRGKKAQFDVELTPIPAGQTWETRLKSYYDVLAQMESTLPYYELVLNGKVTIVSRERFSGVRLRRLSFEVGQYEKIDASFCFTDTGIDFLQPVAIDNVTISSMKWNNSTKQFVDEESGAILREETFNANYKPYLGDWVLTSTSSQLDKTPVSVDVTIEKKIKNASYEISGWSISALRTEYAGEGNLAADGSLTIANMQDLGTYGPYNLIWVRFVISGGQYMLNGTAGNAISLKASSDGNSITVTQATLGGSKTDCMDYFLLDADGDVWGLKVASGYTQSNFPSGSFTMTRSGAVAGAAKAFSQWVESLKWEGPVVDFKEYLAPVDITEE